MISSTVHAGNLATIFIVVNTDVKCNNGDVTDLPRVAKSY